MAQTEKFRLSEKPFLIGRLRERTAVTPEEASYNPAGQFVANRRPAARRAFAVLDPGGRIRTGILRMDSSLLFQLSYSGVVPQVYAASDLVASRSFGRVCAGATLTDARGEVVKG